MTTPGHAHAASIPHEGVIPTGADVVVVRHGELGTKSDQVQHRLERMLQGNIERMLADRDMGAAVTGEHGRLYVHTDADAVADATAVLTNTVGVVSASPAITTDATLDAITGALAQLARDTHEEGSFAVRARRAGTTDVHPFTSQELEREGGAAIWEVLSSPAVDLEDPDRTYRVECRANEAFVFLEKRSGPGGFPYGSQGRVVALVSGGIDSPVATWEMMRRGCAVDVVYFDFEAYGGPDHVARAMRSVRRLAGATPNGALVCHRVPIGDQCARLVEDVGATRMLSLRRLMFAAADGVADRVGAHAIATGESLGQKSSQTGPNLAIGGAHLERPIHRPLLSLDKQVIIDRAKALDTYEDARIDAGCNRVAPDHPETNATLEQVVAAEPDDLLDAVPAMLADAERVTCERPSDPKGQS